MSVARPTRRPALAAGGEVEEAAAEEEVGARAEGRRGAAGGHAAALGGGEVDAVGVQRARAGEAVVLVDVQVAAALGEELLHPVELGGVFGEVGLQVQARLAGAAARR
jgi:hypothetical protein